MQVGSSIKPHGRLVAIKISPKEVKAVNEQVAAIIKREGEITAVRIADSTRQSVSANILPGEIVDFSIQGRSRQNEDGNTDVSNILLARLNLDGANWSDLECPDQVDARNEQGVDCQATDGELRLYIQVTRAEPDGRIWQALGKTGLTSAQIPAEGAADALHKAIEKKAVKIPPSQRGQITLALDATETVSHTFRPVLKSFASRYGSWARELRFNSIWLVGPTVSLTSRLDE